jgi:hypothetical protein
VRSRPRLGLRSKTSLVVAVASVLVASVGSTAASSSLSVFSSKVAHASKGKLPKPTLVGSSAVYSNGKVVFDGHFKVRVGRKLVVVPSTFTWNKLVLQDASLAPLPVPATTGEGNTITPSVPGAYSLTATFTISTARVAAEHAKAPAHQAAKATVPCF